MSGSVVSLHRYPVKSLQGAPVDRLDLDAGGAHGDRTWGLLDLGSGRVASAKRYRQLLDATGGDGSVRLADGRVVDLDDPGAAAVLSEWLGTAVRPIRASEVAGLAYQMTFDPPDDDAELFDIPLADGSLVDLAPVHLLNAPTLAHCAGDRPELDWSVRRFRPTAVVALGDAWAEDGWPGRQLRLGDALLRVDQPTVRCSMPLRAQPAVDDGPALERQAGLFAAMTGLHPAFPNHLGVYCSVVEPGRVRTGDAVTLV